MQPTFPRDHINNLPALLFSFLLIFVATDVDAQVRESDPDTHDITVPLVLSRLTGPITLDGIVDEPAWDAVTPVPLIQYQPVFGGPMTERTEIRIAFDDTYLWVSARLYESDPSNIRANSLTRDLASSDDILAIVLDTFKDNENALWFSTTPLGTRIDRAVSSDAEFTGGGFASVMNQAWNTYWDAESTITDEGWFTEMRIPFSSLGFQDIDGRVEMGMILYRYSAKTSERHIYPPIRPEFSLGFVKPSESQTIILEGVKSSNPVYITPYVSGGLAQVSELNEDGTGFDLNETLSREIGGDLKYSVTDNLTLDVTVNTDFAQVEADVQQVNLTRFSLFFPEKRQFFQERAGIFNFATGSIDRVFHSRQIGISDDGLVSIFGGARLVGRVGGWDLGAINMQTLNSVALPSENFGIVRLRRTLINPRSTAGGLFTSRIGNDGTYNLVYALDAILNLRGTDYFTTKFVQSIADTPYESDTFEFAPSSLAVLQYERRGTVGLGFNFVGRYTGADYNPGIGFVTRRDFYSVLGSVQYGWLLDGTQAIRAFRTSTGVNSYFRNSDSSLESLIARHTWNVDFSTGASASAGVSVQNEDLVDELNLPEDTFVPAGNYTFVRAILSYNFPFGSLVRGRYNVSAGQFYDGFSIQATLGPTWTISKHLEFVGRYQYSYLRFADRNQTGVVHLIGITTNIGINTMLSFSGLLQYNTSADLLSSNMRLRYNFREGNDLWIVFNQNMNQNRTRAMPELSLIEDRTVLLKYTYTFYK